MEFYVPFSVFEIIVTVDNTGLKLSIAPRNTIFIELC